MSVRVMSWVWQHSRSKSTARLVLLAIADCANDAGADAYPSTRTLMAKTALSERGVRQAVTNLEAIGELSTEYKTGPRGCNRYRVVMRDPAPHAGYVAPNAGSTDTRHDMHSAADAGSTRHDVPGTRHEMTVYPAPRAPEPSENHPPTVATQPTEPSNEPSVLARKRATTTADPPTPRGSRIPNDFTATPDMIAWAKAETPLVGAKETAAFVDYWRAMAGQRATKRDWPATWRNWMRKAQADAEQRRARASPNGLVERDGLKLKPETAQRLADRSRFEAMDAANAPPPAIEGPDP